MSTTSRFVGPDLPADVAVLIVTFNSGTHLDTLIESLRREALDQRLRVVVADNASSDDTLSVARAHDDVLAVDTGGNLGYAAGINAAMRLAGQCDALLVLNPDLWLEPGCVAQLRRRMSLEDAGVVVPRILTPDGATYPSLRHEPTLIRALGDAAFGSHFAMRPARLSEIVRRTDSYEYAHPVDWATGAALLISTPTAEAVGPWDERFFLYSEETDFFRRARASGAEVWYEPHAVVRHAQGASGQSVALDTLLTINRIRYARKHHHRLRAAAYRGAVVLHELARVRQPAHRETLKAVLSERTWQDLPRARPTSPATPVSPPVTGGAIIIPAHNEAAVIGRTLRTLGAVIESPLIDVVLVANGCSDETAMRARAIPGTQVLDLAESSKIAALNAGDQMTDRWPRIYLDADIEITPQAVYDVFDALSATGVMAARPPYRWDLRGTSATVRRYFRARAKMPSMHTGLWGAGVYGLSSLGHARFDVFPTLVADDLFVDQLFSSDERRIVDTDPVLVRVPRTARALLAVLRRHARGTQEARASTSSSTLMELMATVKGPGSFLDAAVYTGLAVLSRLSVRTNIWERDDSSREQRHATEEPHR